MANNVLYTAKQYIFKKALVKESIDRYETAENIPEGALVALDSNGLAVRAGASSVVVGVAMYSAGAGTMLATHRDARLQNPPNATSLALTPGARVYAAATGSVATTGTIIVGWAETANIFRVSL